MAWVSTIEPDEAEGQLKAAYGRILSSRGKVANVVQISSLLPQVMERGIDFYLALMFGESALSRARREMVAVEVSRTNRCEYCVRHHEAALARVIRDEAAARKFAETGEAPFAKAAEKAMLAYARKLTATSHAVTGADVGALRKAGFNDEEIVAINHVAAYFNMMNRFVNGLGVELEADKGADASYKY